MTVSVIMPAHNSARFIRESIESVLAQTFRDWELIVADDASTDGSGDIAGSYGDPRIRCVRSETNLGSAGARNLALASATGKFVAFLDSDDLWAPGKLEKQLAFMEEIGCALCATDYVKIDGAGKEVSDAITGPPAVDYRTLLRSNCLACSSMMADRSVHPDLRMPNLKLNHDYALWLSLLREGGAARRLGEPLMRYRVHPGSLSRNKIESARYNWRIYRDLEGLSLFRSFLCMVSFVFRGFRKFMA